MISLPFLVEYLDELLRPSGFKDYCPNGLQIEGKSSIKTLVTGVSINQALINAANNVKADAILVHHGFFWKNESLPLVGIKYKRITSLIRAEVSLLAYHLPLDAHPIYGNNVQLSHHLNIQMDKAIEVEPGIFMGVGKCEQPQTGHQFAQYLSEKLHHQPLHIAGSKNTIQTMGWCTGAAQDFINKAIDYRLDAYITGEISERIPAIALENGIHFFAAGHHATERYGVKALGEHLKEKFDIEHHFIDIPNPV